MTVKVLRRHFSVEEYHQMAQAGVLSEDDRVELIEGEIVEMVPISSRHAACVAKLTTCFAHIQPKVIVWVQNPIRLSEGSEPQPDLALLKPRSNYYADKHPEPEDVLLVVEVAETSRDYDRSTKIPLYAQAGIPEAWLVDLEETMVESYQQPTSQGYKEVRKYQPGEHLAPHLVSDLELTIDEIIIS